MSDHAPYDCNNCTEKQRHNRNCYNRNGYTEKLLLGVDEWKSIPSSRKPVLKIDDLKFMACPVSSITAHTWQLIKLVNRCTGGEGTELQHLPFAGLISDQPEGFLEAVDIMRKERSEYFRQQQNKRKAKQ